MGYQKYCTNVYAVNRIVPVRHYQVYVLFYPINHYAHYFMVTMYIFRIRSYELLL